MDSRTLEVVRVLKEISDTRNARINELSDNVRDKFLEEVLRWSAAFRPLLDQLGDSSLSDEERERAYEGCNQVFDEYAARVEPISDEWLNVVGVAEEAVIPLYARLYSPQTTGPD